MHLVSLAIVPVDRGRRAAARDELYLEINPGVPIDPRSTRVHGFTDADVARKRPFAYFAHRIVGFLDRSGAVLVQHTGVDVQALKAELARARETDPTIDDPPDLPVLDTSTLPRALRLDEVSTRGAVSLATLCARLGVTNTRPHHARRDARATADALVKLLEHAAAASLPTSSAGLLAAHARTVAFLPDTPKHLLRTGNNEPALSDEHLRRHAEPLTHPATGDELAAWLDMAGECARLRCPHLATDADLAASANGPALLDGL